MQIAIKDFPSKCTQIRSFYLDLVTFAEEILQGKLHFLSSELQIGLFSITSYVRS